MKRRVNLLDSVEEMGNTPVPTKKKRKSFLPEGTHGLLEKEAESRARGTISEIEPDLIDVGGPSDRIEGDHRSAADNDLVESISNTGQLLPCLVRPHPETPGRYQSVFGNRRIAACRRLGIPVKAIISDLSDRDLAITKGVENSLRLDPTFIERVLFAERLNELGYNRDQIGEALGIGSKGVISAIMKIAATLPPDLIDYIGAAPSIGRPRWERLANLLGETDSPSIILSELPTEIPAKSDDRFSLALALAEKKHGGIQHSQKTQPVTVFSTENLNASFRRKGKTLALSIKASDDAGFLRWMEEHWAGAFEELHYRYQKESEE